MNPNPNLELEVRQPLEVLPPQQAPAVKPEPTPQEFRAAEINEALMAAYRAAGTLKMTPEEVAKLTAPFPKSVLARIPTKGHTYIPHIFISQRLTQVFGPGQWTMIRRQEKMQGNEIMAEWIMIIRGVFIGESWGSQEYHPNNRQQTFADVLEATRGECIRRIAGKYLDCGGEAWDPAVQRQVSVANARERLETPRAPAPVAPPAAVPPTAPADPVKALKAELWGLLQTEAGCRNSADAQNWLEKYKITKPNQILGDLTADQLSVVLDKTKIQLKDMK
jgi:hypothetical protein